MPCLRTKEFVMTKQSFSGSFKGTMLPFSGFGGSAARAQGIAGKRKMGCSLKQFVYRQIIEGLCSGRLSSDAILTERQIVTHYGVSKAPVREALIQLCYEGVLRSIPRCGYQVVPISAELIQNLTDLRLVLEPASLPTVLENLTEEKIQCLKEACNGHNEDHSPWAVWSRDIWFHVQLNHYAQNAQVTHVLERTLISCALAYAQTFQQSGQTDASPREPWHAKVISALENNELYIAQNCLKQDILDMLPQMLPAYSVP